MAIIPKNLTYEEFCVHMNKKREGISQTELDETWDRFVRFNSLSFATGRGLQSILPADEQGLTNREREDKVFAEAKAQGRNIEKV